MRRKYVEGTINLEVIAAHRALYYHKASIVVAYRLCLWLNCLNRLFAPYVFSFSVFSLYVFLPVSEVYYTIHTSLITCFNKSIEKRGYVSQIKTYPLLY